MGGGLFTKVEHFSDKTKKPQLFYHTVRQLRLQTYFYSFSNVLDTFYPKIMSLF